MLLGSRWRRGVNQSGHFNVQVETLKILAVPGSLRRASINAAFLRTIVRLQPHGIAVELFPGIGDLPLFNPDLDAPSVSHQPAAVVALRTQIRSADALLIASPEYAHGVTGVIKNALDWLVSCEAFVGKAVAVINTSPRAHHADAALRETLKTMSAQLVEDASITVPLLGTGLDEEAMLRSPVVGETAERIFQALRSAVKRQRGERAAAFGFP